MLAVAGGLGAAVAFATATLCNSRSSRMIGATPLLGWVMLAGLAIVAPLVAAQGVPDGLDAGALALLGVAGLGNVAALLFAYAALRIGKVGIVAPVVSTQGAVAAVIAVVAGEHLATAAALLLALIVVGVVLAAISPDAHAAARAHPQRATLYSLVAALSFGASLYATAEVSVDLPVVWALLPARALGVLVVTLPLLLRTELRMTREALPLVLAAGTCEVGAVALFAFGARHGIAVSAVLSSQFAALAGVAAYVLFRERLAPIQLIGVILVVLGVGALSGVQA